MLIRIQ